MDTYIYTHFYIDIHIHTVSIHSSQKRIKKVEKCRKIYIYT